MTALATIVLAIVTGLYLRELRKQRKEMQIPIIEITPLKQSEVVSVAVTNNGPGVALNIKSNINGMQQGKCTLLYKDTRGRPLKSGKGIKYKLSTVTKIDVIQVEVTFEDSFRDVNKVKRDIELSDLREWDERERHLFEHFYGID